MMRFTPPIAAAHRGAGNPQPDPVTYVWTHATRRLPRRLGELTLSSLAVLGVCCMVTVALGLALGIRPLVLRSGSMAPAMPVGTLALARSVDVAEVAVGDVVSVVRDDVRVTHRVVDARPAAGAARLTLQGDANIAPDPDPVLTTRVDRVLVSIPHLGDVARRFGEPRSQFVVGVLTGAALLWSFGRSGPRPIGRWVPAGDVRRGRRARAGATS